MRVLTVDDSRTILAMLHHTLSNAGFEVLQAEDGQKGLEVLKHNGTKIKPGPHPVAVHGPSPSGRLVDTLKFATSRLQP